MSSWFDSSKCKHTWKKFYDNLVYAHDDKIYRQRVVWTCSKCHKIEILNENIVAPENFVDDKMV